VSPTHNSLAAACERALVAGARSQRAGTRQQLRAAARRFVRRHRRDVRYLRWLLRSVAASSALAVALLGLGSSPVHAKATLFTPLTGAANPLEGLDVGIFSAPAVGDLDHDGDVDLVVGDRAGTLHYFENTGGATSPKYVERTGAANPLNGQHVGFFSAPVLGDLDGDGDLDLVAGEFDGTFAYFENTGSATSPAFVRRTGAQNPLDGRDVGYSSTPALADLDGDGDVDLVAGDLDGTFHYFENTGSATSPGFAERTGAANPLDARDVAYYSAPVLGDLDRDGDLDLVAGRADGTFAYFENTGSSTSPAFVARTGAASPLDGQDTGGYSTAALGDLDGDGDLDLVAGGLEGNVLTFENLAGGMVERTGAANPLNGLNVGLISTPALGDLDGDGDLDLVEGGGDGTFRYFENTGSASSPAYIARTGAADPLNGQDVGRDSAPALADLDGDGDLDLVAGGYDGTFRYFENTGTSTSPAFVQRTGAANPLNGEDLGAIAWPTLGDLDGDGDRDLVAGKLDGTLAYFENTGNPTSPAFVQRTGAANPLNTRDVGDYSTPALGDVDGDGDLDLVVGNFDGAFAYFENTGNATSPAFAQRTGAANPLNGRDLGKFSTPALGDLDGDGDLDLVAGEGYTAASAFYFENTIVKRSLSAFELADGVNPLGGLNAGTTPRSSLGDLDGDGDLDLVVGQYSGRFFYFENTGSATSPAYVLRTGAQNPLDGQDVGGDAAPALGDLDGDGDLDLISGRDTGDFVWFENTGSATSPAFIERTGAANPLDGHSVGFGSIPALGDVNGDGRLDLVAGNQVGAFHYFENTGSATSPAFLERTGAANPLDGQDVGDRSAPALADLDGDGDLDLVAGNLTGTFAYFENSGSATSPAFVLRTGAANPLDSKDVGFFAVPALGDLDGDGDSDVVAGDNAGTFHTYYLPEPAQGLMLGAGAALLKLLERWRLRLRRRT
jgi:hypothetical protein